MFNWANWPPEFTLSSTASFPNDFPNLRPHLCANQVSTATRDYNCIAWAASDSGVRWEPDPFFQYYWPDGVPRAYTVPAFVAAFQSIGYELCENGEPEEGMEKIVLYARSGEPTHAARRLPNGNWTSKLGDFEDIEHVDVHCVGGALYGAAQTYMRRKIV
jgi:hypothetical protein